MKLYLAVAVLMLAFVAYTEAQDRTFEEKFTALGEEVTNAGQTVLEKVKTTLEGVHNSDFAVRSRAWFTEQAEKLKAKIAEISQ